MSDRYDVVVIGAGPGGYPAAIRAKQLGLKVVCIEKERPGGVCLNWGCIPSKALLKSAEVAHEIRDAASYGLRTGPLEIDFPAVVARSRKAAEKMEKGVRSLFKKYGVEHVEGTATIEAPGQVRVNDRVIAGDHILIATGARARVFPGIQADGERVQTYREAIVSTTRPDVVTVLGAGAIGVEFAYFWNAMGAKVTVVEGLDEVVPVEDREIGRALRRELEKQGITFLLGKRITSCKRDGETVVTALEDGTQLTSDRALVALGIAANVENLGLEALGVTLDGGRIRVDTSHRTNIPGIYAIGDVSNAGPALAHAATRQAHVCIERIAGLHVPDVDYLAMPGCTYCLPQVASMGYTEEAAKKAGLSYKVGKFPFMANGKAVGAGHPEGFVKVLIDPKYGEILGAHVIGHDASELIGELVLARSAEVTAEHLIHTVHAHPTYGEAIMEAVAQALAVTVHL